MNRQLGRAGLAAASAAAAALLARRPSVDAPSAARPRAAGPTRTVSVARSTFAGMQRAQWPQCSHAPSFGVTQCDPGPRDAAAPGARPRPPSRSVPRTRGAPDDADAADAAAARDPQTEYYYLEMRPGELGRTSASHALFGALLRDGLVERYRVYRRATPEGAPSPQHSGEPREVTVVSLKLGTGLNGHGGIVHGGITALLFDEAMGWACHCLATPEDLDGAATTVVTASLTVDFRAPLPEGSEAVVRVSLDRREGRKIYFSAVLESPDGGVVFAEARSLFLCIPAKRLERG